MAQQTMTFTISQALYNRIAEQAKQSNRPIIDETLSALEEKFHEPTEEELFAWLAHMKEFSDEKLWYAAQLRVTDDEQELMEGLLYKQQKFGLTRDEEEQTELLSAHANKIMLMRAQAAVLLKDRGHDISSLGPSQK